MCVYLHIPVCICLCVCVYILIYKFIYAHILFIIKDEDRMNIVKDCALYLVL